MKGTGDVAFLREHDVKIWEAWTREDGTLGPVCGKQWRRWNDTRIVDRYDFVKTTRVIYTVDTKLKATSESEEDRVVLSREIDQLQRIVDKLRRDPTDRRIMMSAWNVGELEDMALPPATSCITFGAANSALKSVYARQIPSVKYTPKYLHESRYTALLAEIARCGEASEGNAGLIEHPTPCALFCNDSAQRRCIRGYAISNIAGYGILTSLIAQVTNHMPMMFLSLRFGRSRLRKPHERC